MKIRNEPELTGDLVGDLEKLVDHHNAEVVANLQNEGRVAFAKGRDPDAYSPELSETERHEWLHGYFAAKTEHERATKAEAAYDALASLPKPKRKSPAKRVARAERILAAQGEHSGGSVDYYVLTIEHPTHQTAPYTVECNDIIEALEMDFAEGNVFKALWRTAAARQGKLKKGHDAKYDAEKIVFYGQRLLERAKRNLEG